MPLPTWRGYAAGAHLEMVRRDPGSFLLDWASIQDVNCGSNSFERMDLPAHEWPKGLLTTAPPPITGAASLVRSSGAWTTVGRWDGSFSPLARPRPYFGGAFAFWVLSGFNFPSEFWAVVCRAKLRCVPSLRGQG